MTQATDRSDPSSIYGALSWLEGTLLGPIATAIAVLAIVAMGFALLSGRIDARRAARLIFGCFIVFGASALAQGILGTFSPRDNGAGSSQIVLPLPPPTPANPEPNTAPADGAVNPFDPYGSGKPQQR